MKKGFTLIELLVVIFIINLISALVLPNFPAIKEEFSLARGIFKLAKDLKMAREEAMSLKKYDCPSGNLEGYGIKFQKESQSYSFFARCSSLDIEIENLSLDGNLKIKNLKKDGILVNSLVVFFQPPNPKVSFGLEDNQQVEIIISPKNNFQTKTVKINKIGLIEIIQ